MTNLTVSLNDVLVQQLHSHAALQGLSLEQFIVDALQKQVAEQPDTKACKPKRIGRYRSGRGDISVHAKTLARQLMSKKHERYR